ncbi:SNF2 domain-containing protein CLASSY 3-like [Mercurialis annua]|uniref:SNF2 domain-containing protein CLASSY 3-like n=1 Tax=Mercurialis annua TaxID=3986 RepID=UPI0021604879|nr:SNF2 domain-containing protein CLASSY 3-like [Mercurialis annua]
MDYRLPVSARTRSREAKWYKHIYEEIKPTSSSASLIDLHNKEKSFSSGSCQKNYKDISGSASFSGGKKMKKSCSKGRIENGDSFGETNLGDDGDNEEGFDLGASNSESDGVVCLDIDTDDEDSRVKGCKKTPEVEESCSGWKSSFSDDEIVEISGGEESEEITVIGSEQESDEEESDEEESDASDEDYNEGKSDTSFDSVESSGEDDEPEKEQAQNSSGREKTERVKMHSLDDTEIESLGEEETEVLSRQIGIKRKGKNVKMHSLDDSDIVVIDDEESEVSSREFGFKRKGEKAKMGLKRKTNSLEFDSVSKRTRSYNTRQIKYGGSSRISVEETTKQTKREGSSRISVEEDDDSCEQVQDLSKRQPIKKRTRTFNDNEVVKILGNSMFHEDSVICEEKEIAEEAPVEKSEEEKELDTLWNEMALALCANDAVEEETKADVFPKVEPHTADLCQQGNHQFILDEEIGILCKFCSFVDQEIEYYSVPFGKKTLRNSGRRDPFGERSDIVFDKFHDHGNDSKHSYDSCTHERGTVWDIIPGIGKDLHEHQRDGFEFLWKMVAGGIHLDKLKEPSHLDGESGCIISHAPGTGKTRLAIVFLHSYMKLYPTCRPLIIAPCSMLLSWEAEFEKWKVDIPFHNLNQTRFSGKENAVAMRMIKSGQQSVNSIRMVKLYSWKKDKGVLGISYKLFEELGGEENKRGNARCKSNSDVRKALLELPSLVFLDEGHTPRNDQSLIFKALLNIRTDKRIILSGTPFQNNFDELYNTLLLVRPKFADHLSYRGNGFLTKKKRDSGAKKTWTSMTNSIVKDGNNRFEADMLDEVRRTIDSFVHVHKGNILQERLPGLRDSVVILQPISLQKRLLDKIQVEGCAQPLKLEYQISVTSVHPALMSKDSFEEKQKLDPNIGVKTKFLMELILLSKAIGEKVLVFSQYRAPLELIGEQLQSRFNWIEGKEILHMHGAIEADHRQSLIKDFNAKKSDAKVLLASTKACSEGINLVGASRVVLLDVVWNPSVERQAISRAYRLGQEKVVYVYHLIASGTMEEDKYCRQARKERLSELVFYSSDSDNAHSSRRISPDISDDKKDKLLEEIIHRNNLTDILKKIIYQPKEFIFQDSYDLHNL